MAIGIGSAVQRLANPMSRALRELYSIGGKDPKLVADFDDEYYRANGGKTTFSDLITHARAGNATMTDSDGLIKWAPHNLLIYSEDFTAGAWSSDVGGTTITSNYAVAPNGTNTAERLQLSATGGSYLAQSFSAVAGISYTFAVFVKATSGTSDFDLYENTTGLPVTKGTQTATSEWQLFSFEFTSASTATRVVGINNGDDTYASDILIWGAHLYRSDLGGMVNNPDRGDSYVPTTSSAVYLPRRGHHKYNGDQWVNKGLLVESEARTNLITYSNDFSSDWTISNASLTADQLTSPDGQVNASLLAGNGSSSFPTLSYALSISSTTTVTFSFHVKANTADKVFVRFAGTNVNGGTVSVTGFNFATETFDTRTGTAATSSNYEKLANGWYRLSVTVTGDAFTDVSIRPEFSAANTDSVYIYGAQLEAASTPSSYIPTNGATVTRAAETVTVPYANLPWPTPTYIGDELVTNGTFDTDTSGWTADVDGTVSWDNGTLKYTGTATGPTYMAVNQTIITEVGKVYLASFEVTAYSPANAIRLNVDSVKTAETASIGVATGIFVATGTSTVLNIGIVGGLSGETFNIDSISVREINPLSVSIAMMGEMDYSDDGLAVQVDFMQWNKGDGLNYILQRLRTTDARVGEVRFFQAEGGTVDTINSDADAYSPDLNVPFNIASRHGSTFINGAVDGIALTADTTPTALPDLSTTNLNLAYDFNGTISEFRIWDRDIQDAGIAEATKPSLEPSLSLTFDGQPSSFTNTGLTV